MMKLLLVLGVLCCSAFAEVSKAEVDEACNKLGDTAAFLEKIYGAIVGGAQVEFNEKAAAAIAAGANKECVDGLVKKSLEAVKQRSDETCNGYAFSCRSLINDLRSDETLNDEEKAHTIHMLGKHGSYYPQMENSVRFMHIEIDQMSKNFNTELAKC